MAPPGNIAIENPLEDLFKATPTEAEEDELEQEPQHLFPTDEQVEQLESIQHRNRLRKDRSNIYSSITNMTMNINNVMTGRGKDEWEDLADRATRANNNLWKITNDLKNSGFQIPVGENAKVVQYSLEIESLTAKIKVHVRTLELGIATCIASTAQAMEPPRAIIGTFTQNEAMMRVISKLDATLTNLVPRKDEPDYRGLKPIEIPSFDGDTSEFHFFRKSFEAAHNYRNLDKTTMALHLKSYLRGPAEKLARAYLNNQINETSYDVIWEALERRYGGSYNETASITEQFNELEVLMSLDCKDLERTYDSFKLQSDYYTRYDPNALTNEKSMLNTQAKSKLTVELGAKHIQWCEAKKVPRNFNSMVEWLNIRYAAALKSEREFANPSAKKSRERRKPPGDFRTQHPIQEPDERDGYDGEGEQSETEQDLWTKTASGKFRRFHGKPKFHKKFPIVDELSEQTGFKEQSVFHSVSAYREPISLQTVVCNVEAKGTNIPTIALLDTGTSITVIDEDFALENNLKILDQREGQEVFLVDRLIKKTGFQYKVEITISPVDNNKTTSIEAWTIKNLVHDFGIVDWSEHKSNFPPLRKINFPKLPVNPKIVILFGSDTTRLFTASTVISDETNPDCPVAMRTFLGWTCVEKSTNIKQLKKDPTSQLAKVLLGRES